MVKAQDDFVDIATLKALSTEEMCNMILNLQARQFELEQLNAMLQLTVEGSQAGDRRFRIFLENSYDVLFTLDDEGRIVFASSSWEREFGSPNSTILGSLFVLIIHPDDVTLWHKYLHELLNGVSSKFSPPFRVKHADGSWRWLETNGMPYVDANGTLMFTGAARDITANRKLEEQLIKAQKMEAIGELAGGLAHDFNNVLSIINGYCCLMGMDVEQDSQFAEYVNKILAASNRAGELTHSMLAFSRTQVMTLHTQNLNMIVSNVGSFVGKIIGDNIQFKIVLNEAILPVHVDSGQIEQVLINLTTNARDAMPDGGELTISTDQMYVDAPFISANGFGKPGRYAVLTVSDTGKGLDEITRKKIFEPFFTTKEVGKGTGLGLAMVYGIVKQHNGFTDVFSEQGRGASFVVFLPIAGTQTADSELKDSDRVEVTGGSETILVVEDDADVLEFMHKILIKIGYQVILAVDGQDGVDKFRDNADNIQLIIMDMIMARKSGKQAYDEIKQIKPDAKALFSSGYSAKIIQQQGELGGNAEFISKPVQPGVLLKKVREMLDR